MATGGLSHSILESLEQYIDEELYPKKQELLSQISSVDGMLNFLEELNRIMSNKCSDLMNTHIEKENPKTVGHLISTLKGPLDYLDKLKVRLQMLDVLRTCVSSIAGEKKTGDQELDQILVDLPKLLSKITMTDGFIGELDSIFSRYTTYVDKRSKEYEESYRFLSRLLEDIGSKLPEKLKEIPPYRPRPFDGDPLEGLSELQKILEIGLKIEKSLEESGILQKDALILYREIGSVGYANVMPENISALESLSKYVPLKVTKRQP